MNRPIVIVDPLSSGIELAPAFKAHGIPAIAITLPSQGWIGFGNKINAADFIEIIPNQPNIADIIRKYNPIGIIPGTEEGILLAEQLTELLTPAFSNDPAKSLHRVHKAYMQQALSDAGVPVLKTFNAASVQDAERWIAENALINSPLIVKPPMSAGSDKVFHIPARGDWRSAFNCILTEPSMVTGKASETVVVQEQAIGTEFAVGTVSADGKHYLAHLIKYTKMALHGRKTVFDHVEFIEFDDKKHEELLQYTKQALDALGIRWGAAHTEIILTENGPRFIESGARMCGGPVVGFAREASGSSQADRLVELYATGDVLTKKYDFKKSVMPVFLKSSSKGTVENVEAFAGISNLPTLFKKYIWFNNNDVVPQTVDYLTSIGIVALTGDRESMMLDYEKIREMESRLIIVDAMA